MTSLQKVILGVAVVLAAIASVASVLALNASSHAPQPGSSNLTGIEQTNVYGFANGIQIGPNSGAPVLKLVGAGTCNLSTAVASFTASTTQKFTCQPGAQYTLRVGDIVAFDLATSSPGPNSFGTIAPLGPSFVSVAGSNPVLTTYLYNSTGQATTSYPIATTSAQFYVFRI